MTSATACQARLWPGGPSGVGRPIAPEKPPTTSIDARSQSPTSESRCPVAVHAMPKMSANTKPNVVSARYRTGLPKASAAPIVTMTTALLSFTRLAMAQMAATPATIASSRPVPDPDGGRPSLPISTKRRRHASAAIGVTTLEATAPTAVSASATGQRSPRPARSAIAMHRSTWIALVKTQAIAPSPGP